jgi:uncharacterized protein YegJ (DUF2314 family)
VDDDDEDEEEEEDEEDDEEEAAEAASTRQLTGGITEIGRKAGSGTLALRAKANDEAAAEHVWSDEKRCLFSSNQSINQSVIQSINQSINQSTDRLDEDEG